MTGPKSCLKGPNCPQIKNDKVAAAFVPWPGTPCTLPATPFGPCSCASAPASACVQSSRPASQLKCVYAVGTWKKIVLKIVGLLLLFAILCGAFFRQRFANFALRFLVFLLFLHSPIFLFLQNFFLVFCFGPTPFGKLMRKFFVNAKFRVIFQSTYTHTHTDTRGRWVCVCDGFLSVCKLATAARCLFDAACPRSCLSTCLCRLIDGYYAHLYSDLPAPSVRHAGPPSIGPWVACNLTQQTTRWSSPCGPSMPTLGALLLFSISNQMAKKAYKKVLAACHFLGGCSGLD